MIGRLAVIGAILAVAIVAIIVAASSGPAAAATIGPDPADVSIQLAEVAGGFREPVFVTGDGVGGRYVVELRGVIRRWPTDEDAERPIVLDLRDAVRTGSERGLLGLAFHPAFPQDTRLFLDYTHQPDGATVVSELVMVDGMADVSSERILLVIDQPFAIHNGGMIAFDASGHLLIGTGDGGAGGDPLSAGQDPGTLLGKLLRIDVDDDGTEPRSAGSPATTS